VKFISEKNNATALFSVLILGLTKILGKVMQSVHVVIY